MASKSKTAAATRRKSDFLNHVKAKSSDPLKFSGKKSLPEPTHVGHFFMMMLMKICRTILFVDTSVKIGVYLIGVMIGSVICDLFVVPQTFLSHKHNPLNQYFVKIGWGWTLTFVGLYILMTSFIYCCRDKARICQHLMRLVVGTFWWLACTTLFVRIENLVGICSSSEHGDKMACVNAGKRWLGFDISGHVFLEIHCLLIISEEVKTFKEWLKLKAVLEDEDIVHKRRITQEEIFLSESDYKALTPYIKIVVACLSVMLMLFEVMLLSSTIYRFHTLSQKVSASFIAVGCWFISYRIIYRSDSPFPFIPVTPGHSPLQFMKCI